MKTAQSQTESRWMRWIPLWLAITIAVAYSSSVNGVFVFDDFAGIVNNPHIRSLTLSTSGTSRPVVYFSYYVNLMLDQFVSGGSRPLSPVGFHLVSTLIHILSAILLYRIARFALMQVPDARGTLSPTVTAAAIALLWGLHPIGSSAVTYLSQRAEAIMALFFLLTVYSVIRLSETGASRWLIGGILACAAGMASKEVMLTAPLLVLLYDRTFIGKTFLQALRKRWLFHAGCFATLCVPSILIYSQSQAEYSYAWQGTSGLHYFYTQVLVLMHYLRLTFIPTGLCLDYNWPVNREFITALPAMICLFVFGIATLVAFFRRPAIGYPALAWFVILAPTSSFLPLPDCAFDHRMYLPLAGIIPYGVLAVTRLKARIAMAFLTVAAVSLGCLTFKRNLDFRSEQAIWQSVVQVVPDNLRARIDLAIALAEAGHLAEALSEYESVIQRIPSPDRERLESGRHPVLKDIPTNSYEYHYMRARLNMGITLRQQGNIEPAISNFVAALCVIPHYPQASDQLAKTLISQGTKPEELKATITDLVEKRRRGVVE